MAHIFRHAMCNEAYEGRSFGETCRGIRNAGYSGIEIAPFTLAERPADIGAVTRREYRDAMAVRGPGFRRSALADGEPEGIARHHAGRALAGAELAAYSLDLIDLCADLGPDGVMVFGSPQAALHHAAD